MSCRFPIYQLAGMVTHYCPVPNEVRQKYVDIIDDILTKADLTQVTEKRIRNGIQERVEYDITPQKVN